MPVIHRPDVDLHVDLAGEGPPVLFIQGIGVTGTGWSPQVRDLSGAFSCATFDNRGIGRSVPCGGPITIEAMAADAAAVLDGLGWASAHVVGHSMGGVIAEQLALDHPGRVRSLSLLCTFASGAEGTRATPRVIWLGLRSRLGTLRLRRNAFLEMLYPAEHLARVDRDMLAAELAPVLGRDLAAQPPIVMRQLRALGRHDASDRLGALAGLPTLVANGVHDPIARPDEARRLARAIPGARHEERLDASHGLPLQHVDWTNALLRAHFDGADRSRAAS